MTDYELLTKINELLDIVVWPVTVLIGLLLFRSNIQRLIDRFNKFGGRVGDFSFEVSLEEYAEQTAGEVTALERQGRNSEAKAILNNASRFIMESYGLSSQDIQYLLKLADGDPPARRWGKVNLVRAGLIDLDGGKLTPHGKQLVNGLLRKLETGT